MHVPKFDVISAFRTEQQAASLGRAGAKSGIDNEPLKFYLPAKNHSCNLLALMIGKSFNSPVLTNKSGKIKFYFAA